MLCSYCERGELQAKESVERFSYKGHDLVVSGYAYSECDKCHEEIVTAEQMRANQALITDAKRRVDGLLTGAEIRDVRAALGLSQADASRVFGGGPNSFYKYERGEVMQSVSLDRLMRVVRHDVDAYRRLRVLAGLSQETVPVAFAGGGAPSAVFRSAEVADYPLVVDTLRWRRAPPDQGGNLVSDIDLGREWSRSEGLPN